ncbi:MAG: polysaccharide deacetylase family protein [Firmicutes bacterium]|nr:polysaccharide deacetylase family protein [Bacillota bacterium]
MKLRALWQNKKAIIAAVAFLLLLGSLAAVVFINGFGIQFIGQLPAHLPFTKHAKLLVLMYHDISEETPLDAERIAITTTAAKLAADIDDLIELGYEPIALEDYYNGQAQAGHKYFVISFDDGYVGVHDLAYPVLVEKQVPACIFFNTGMEIYDTFLSYGQLWHMEKSGLIKVYSHLEYHINATEMTQEEFIEALDTSMTKLRRFLWQEQKFLAYPYGAYNRKTYKAAQEFGVQLQLVQKKLFFATDVLVRVNVPYDANINKLIKMAPYN